MSSVINLLVSRSDSVAKATSEAGSAFPVSSGRKGPSSGEAADSDIMTFSTLLAMLQAPQTMPGLPAEGVFAPANGSPPIEQLPVKQAPVTSSEELGVLAAAVPVAVGGDREEAAFPPLIGTLTDRLAATAGKSAPTVFSDGAAVDVGVVDSEAVDAAEKAVGLGGSEAVRPGISSGDLSMASLGQSAEAAREVSLGGQEPVASTDESSESFVPAPKTQTDAAELSDRDAGEQRSQKPPIGFPSQLSEVSHFSQASVGNAEAGHEISDGRDPHRVLQQVERALEEHLSRPNSGLRRYDGSPGAGANGFGQGASSEIEIRLHPEHLGRVNLKLTLEDGVLSARISVATPAAREAVDQGLSQLRQALGQQGFDVGSLDVLLGGAPNFGGDPRQGFRFSQGRERRASLAPVTAVSAFQAADSMLGSKPLLDYIA